MLNKNPRVIVKIGAMRMLCQRTDPEFGDSDFKTMMDARGGDSPDTFQVAYAYWEYKRRIAKKDGSSEVREFVGTKPSIWFRIDEQTYNNENLRVLMEVYKKYRRRRPLIVELRFGSYEVVPVWQSGRTK